MRKKEIIVYKEPFMRLKKQFCHKCGSRLKVDYHEDYEYHDDEAFFEIPKYSFKKKDFEFDENGGVTQILTYYYYCPNCGAEYEMQEQAKIAQAQKDGNKNILTDEEIIQIQGSDKNVKRLELKKIKNLIIFFASCIIFLITCIFSIINFVQKKSIAEAFLCIALIFGHLAIEKFFDYKQTKIQIYNVQNPITEEEKAQTLPFSEEIGELKDLKSKLILKFITLGLYVVGCIFITVLLIQKSKNNEEYKGAVIEFIILLAFFCIPYVLKQIKTIFDIFGDYLDLKRYLKQNQNKK